MAALFVVVHVAYYASGVQFDATTLTWFYQYLDPELLRHRLAESLFYLHSQPPVFNLLLGVVLKAFPGREESVFYVLYMSMGFGLYVALFSLLRKVGVSAGIALALSTGFMVSPSFILYEHWVFYTFPLALLLTLSALLFWKVLDQKKAVHAIAFFAVLFLLCGIRSMFHVAYYAFLTAAVAVLCPRTRRTVLAAALLPGLLLGSLYVKNFLVFGHATTSSWMGINLAGTTVCAIPGEERAQYVREGKLSPLAMIARFADLDEYPESYREVSGFDGIPALREERKSAGATNYNHLSFIAISDVYLRDALWVIRHRPTAVLVGQVNSWLAYLRSSSDYPLLSGNLDRITAINDFYDYAFYGEVPFLRWDSSRIRIYYAIDTEPRVYVFLLIGLPVLVAYGLRRAARGSSLSPTQRALVGYVCFQIIYVGVIGNLFEVSENQRFRFTTDPLSVVLLGLALQGARSRAAGRLQKSAGKVRRG